MARPLAYAPALVERYPLARGVVIEATGLDNGPSPQALAARFRAEQGAVALRLGTVAIADLPSIAAWRRVFGDFGAKPTQHRNAAEALLRRLHKQGEIPAIGALVDLGNLVSIRHALPVAAFDRAGLVGRLTVRFADGTERFTELGSDGPVHPEPGEVVFADDSGVVSARRWCWRQSAQSAVGPHTRDALLVIEGQHATAQVDVDAAARDLLELLAEHQPRTRAQRYDLPPASAWPGSCNKVHS